MGELFLIPTPIGNLKEVSPRVIEVLNFVDFVACEDTRNTSKLLSLIGISKKCISCHEHNEKAESEKIIQQIIDGKNVAYASDAGYPCISDPGSILVKAAIDANIKITPLSGPNAFLNALVGSGIDSSRFLFYGFLDAKTSAREKQLMNLKTIPYTLIFYESPHRIKDTLLSLEKILGNRKIAIARELTKLHEEFIRSDLSTLNKENHDYIGEMVLIVEKFEASEDANDLDYFFDKVKDLTNSGFSKKDAVNAVSILLGANKNKLYKYVLNKDEQ